MKSIRDEGSDEILRKITELRHELFNLRFQLETHQLENPMRIRKVRKSIARMETVIRERALAPKQEAR
ncbi:MAG: 50S ribosomal protein L29 [Deltaproteobacteria bacterium]